ncbi:lathosterol oxidase [Nocardioides luteus]|uniref:Sterol desaturase n=1 Tax=Nocardioides luteus TaxID=1844 RepID=A0ABQ5T070_9ACTN|nr:sterol desaturase family protein [Nocardioides luteus]MDR7310384.1 lathosterol oxidase [Nocardioides luteus]GGR53121.1 sterol desaturase [Nocardioides luteus]GLJ69837.1 sterol desaturase [Nocardioides luteus]
MSTTLLRHHLLAPAASCFLGVLSLATVLCFHFPELLTTREFRAVYAEDFARTLLLVGLAAAFFTGTIAVLRDQHRRLALTGVGTATVAVLLGGTGVPFEGPVPDSPFALGLDWFVLALFFSALVFIPLEHAFARRPVPVFRPGWRTDACYFFISHVLVQLILILVTTSTSWLVSVPRWSSLSRPLMEAQQAWIRDLPFVAAFALAVFLADLAQAVLHRCYHRIMVLWRFHAVHHSSPELDWLAGSRVHFVETVLTRSIVLLPLLFLGFSTSVVNAYAVLVGIQAVVAHANIGVRFGFLEYLIVLPRYHHWHHARHRDYWDRNYAIHLPVVDMLMGSFKLPRDGSWPEEYGVLKRETVPVGILAQHVAPFRGPRTYDNYVR